ncbi:hypothetical protein ABW20_dc0108065 [Dactylellina cionopaga]|nr:hypothetical protein ABW20_dc0108065 [Dactylellina cionopaga]
MLQVWTADNDRKLLIRLIDKSAKSYNSEALCQLFEGATPKAIEERIAKLKREAKALDSRCAVQPSAPHKPKGNYYTAPPVPGHCYGGLKRNIVQTQGDSTEEDGQEAGKAGGKPAKKARSTKTKTNPGAAGDEKVATTASTADMGSAEDTKVGAAV